MPGIQSASELVQQPLTEIRVGELYFCYEYRLVSVCGQEIELTPKEFDIFALLIMNCKRVLTYEMQRIVAARFVAHLERKHSMENTPAAFLPTVIKKIRLTDTV